MKNNSNDLSRRSFVAASVAGSALAASARAIAAARAPRVIGANDRLHIGVIGAGGNATGHMKRLIEIQEAENTEIIAVCDAYQKRLDAAAELTGGKPYHDYRRLLDNPDIDYVVISVPEHWHAQMTLDAVDAGKHIYCEKPMTYSIEEAKRVRDRVKQSTIKMQVGVQGMSDDSYEAAQRYIKDGKIGKVVMARLTPTAFSRGGAIGIIRAASPRTCSSIGSRASSKPATSRFPVVLSPPGARTASPTAPPKSPTPST